MSKIKDTEHQNSTGDSRRQATQYLDDGCSRMWKSMLAKRMATILPQLTLSESIDVTIIHSCAGILEHDGLVLERPFDHHIILYRPQQ